MAGNQVLEWADLDTEIKTAGLKNVSILMSFLTKKCFSNAQHQDPLAPPDL